MVKCIHICSCKIPCFSCILLNSYSRCCVCVSSLLSQVAWSYRSIEGMEKRVKILLDNNLPGVMRAYLEGMRDIEWIKGPVETEVANFIHLLPILRNFLFKMSTQLAASVCDLFFDLILDQLSHMDLMMVSSDSGVKLLSALLESLGNLVQINCQRSSKIAQEVKAKVEPLMKKYCEQLKKSQKLSFFSHKILSFVQDDDSQLPQLPFNRFQRFARITVDVDVNVDEFLADVEHIVKRLASISLKYHLAQPWKYAHEFW